MSDIVEKLISTPADIKTREAGQHPAVGILSVKTLPPGEYLLRLLPSGQVTTYLRGMQVVLTCSSKIASALTNVQPQGCTNRWNIYHLNVGRAAEINSVCLGDTPIADGYVKIKGSYLVHRSVIPLWSGNLE